MSLGFVVRTIHGSNVHRWIIIASNSGAIVRDNVDTIVVDHGGDDDDVIRRSLKIIVYNATRNGLRERLAVI